MTRITRTEAIKQVEEFHGVKVDHILIPQVDSFKNYSHSTYKADSGLEHYMNEDGIELGYISPISKEAFIFPEGREWAQSFKDDARVEGLWSGS